MFAPYQLRSSSFLRLIILFQPLKPLIFQTHAFFVEGMTSHRGPYPGLKTASTYKLISFKCQHITPHVDWPPLTPRFQCWRHSGDDQHDWVHSSFNIETGGIGGHELHFSLLAVFNPRYGPLWLVIPSTKKACVWKMRGFRG